MSMSICVNGRVECQHSFWSAVCFSLRLRLCMGEVWEYVGEVSFDWDIF